MPGRPPRFGSALRLRGPDPVLTGNTFDGTNQTPTTSLLFLGDPAKNTITPAPDQLFDQNVFMDAYFDSSAGTVRLTSLIESGAVTLQSVIDGTPDGETLLVNGGTFTENVNVANPITLDGNFTLNGIAHGQRRRRRF